METIDLAVLQLPPHLRERRARAWFDTVFNPFIKGLEQELYLLSIHNWTYRSNPNRLDRLGLAERWVDYPYRDNLTDVRQSLPDFREYEESHNKLPIKLFGLCRALDTQIRENVAFIEQIERCVTELQEANPKETKHLSLANNFHETKIIIAGDISEYFVNTITELSEKYIYAHFYNTYREKLESILSEDNAISSLRQEIEQCAEELKKNITSFYNYILSIRQEISIQLDLPFVELE